MSAATENQTCKLTLTINGTDYAIRPVPLDQMDDETYRAFRIRKPDGTAYVVSWNLRHEVCCTCESHKYHPGEICKHGKVLMALGFFPTAAQQDRLAKLLHKALKADKLNRETGHA